MSCCGGAWEILAFHSCGHAVACLPISSLYAGLPRAGRARGTPPTASLAHFFDEIWVRARVWGRRLLRAPLVARCRPLTRHALNEEWQGLKARDVLLLRRKHVGLSPCMKFVLKNSLGKSSYENCSCPPSAAESLCVMIRAAQRLSGAAFGTRTMRVRQPAKIHYFFGPRLRVPSNRDPKP